MIIIQKNFMPLPILNFIRVLLLSLPLVTANENDSEDFLLAHKNPVNQIKQPFELKFPKLPSSLATLGDLFQINLDDDITLGNLDFSSDQISYNEPQIKIGNYKDIPPQEPVDQSNVDAPKAVSGELESLQNTINQDSNNVLLELANEKDTFDDSVMTTNHSTMQKLPQLSIHPNKDSNAILPSNKYQYSQYPTAKPIFGELQNLYTEQSVKSEPNPIPAIQNINEESPQQNQFNEVNYGFAPFNQFYVNQQTFLDQVKNIKLPQMSTDPSAYWRYPHLNISDPYQIKLDEFNSIVGPNFLRNYDSVHNNLFNLGNNVQYSIDPITYGKDTNPSNNGINNTPDNPTIEQLSLDQITNLNPPKFWIDENSNYLPPQTIPQFQPYQYLDSQIDNRYQYPYFPDYQLINYQPPHIYKPLYREIYSDFANNKEQFVEPTNGLPLYNQLQSENYNEGQLQLDQITYDVPNQVTIDQPIHGDHQALIYIEPSQYPFTNNEDHQDISVVQDGGQNEPMDTVHEDNNYAPLWFEVNKYSNGEPSGFTFEQKHDGIEPEVLMDYIDGDKPHNIPIDQGRKPQATYTYQENNFKSEPSLSNQNGMNVFSEYKINEINNEPGTWFNEQSDMGEIQKTSANDVNISYPEVSIDLFNSNKDSQVPIDKTNDMKFAQEHIKEFPNEFENNKLINKQEEAVTPSLFLTKIINGALHQVDEPINVGVEQDFTSKTSHLYDETNKNPPQLTSDNGNNDVLHRTQNYQITTWESPQIHIDQAGNGDHQSRFDQLISIEADHISIDQDTDMDLAINNVEIQESSKSESDIDHPLILIDLSEGILQSAGETIYINGPYLAVDYDSSERYSTFWNPLAMPFGFSDYYIIFDLKASYTVTKIYIMNYGDTVHDITAFTLEVCDGSNNWKIISNFFCQAGIGTSQEFRGSIGTGRFWKFTATKTASGYQPWLVEMGFHGLKGNTENDQGYLDGTSSEISSDLEYSSGNVNDSLSARTVARQKIIASVHIVSWIYYLVGLVVLALAMLFMTCLIMHLAKKRNGLYNITLVMGKNKEDQVTHISAQGKDYTASAPPALPPASSPVEALDSKMIQTSIQ